MVELAVPHFRLVVMLGRLFYKRVLVGLVVFKPLMAVMAALADICDLRPVRVGLAGEDRRGLYADVCSVVSQTGTNIRSVELTSGEGGMTGSVVVEVENLTHLNKVIKAIRRVKGVVEVRRRDRAIA